MDRAYDLFEIDRGKSIWHAQVTGLTQAGLQLRELSDQTPNECFAVHLPTNDVVARLNVQSPNNRAPLLFQIAYDPKLAVALSYELTLQGYRFACATANEVACAILETPMPCDLFIVGYAAFEDVRREMSAWLRACYPAVPVIAINSSPELKLADADYNLELNGEDALLPVIARALHPKGKSV